MGIRSNLRDIAIDLDRKWDTGKLKLLRSVGGAEKLQILSYRGIGRPDRLFLKGRVLVDRGSTTWESDDDFWDDLVNMYRRLHTTEIPGARVKASAAGAVAEVVTDQEGYFDLELEAVDQPFSIPRQQVELELSEPKGKARVLAQGEVVIRSPNASFIVVSDIDDTVLHTQATNLLAKARPKGHKFGIIQKILEFEPDGAALFLVDDSLEISRHAADHGWIRQEGVATIAAEVEAGDKLPGPLDELIDAPPSSLEEDRKT